MTGPPLYEEFTFLPNVSRETYDSLVLYHDLLLKWGKKINLISPSTYTNAWDRHFIDSMQILSLLPNDKDTIFDLGSGAGFPGLVLSVLKKKHVVLIESDKKKTIFLSEVIRQTKSLAKIQNSRIENFNPISKADVITSRACASLGKLLQYSKPLLKDEGICVFLKGRSWQEELDEASKTCMFHVEHFPSITDPAGRILKLSHIN